MAKKRRLDEWLITFEQIPTLQEAQALIMAGKVIVNNEKITKPGTPIPHDATLRILAPPSPYVSRGGEKLAPAIQTFGISCHDAIALDIGISTGGFTDYLRQNGAAWVIGIDVGYGQVAMKLQQDPHVIIIERCNARTLTPDTFEAVVQKQHHDAKTLLANISLVVMDVSFISVTKVLPTIAMLAPAQAQYVILIKPQFEATKAELPKGGIISEPQLQNRILERVKNTLIEQGFHCQNQCKAGIAGTKGNQEYFLHLTHTGKTPGIECCF